MLRTMTSLAAIILATATIAGSANARQTPNQITAQLNRAQLQGTPLYSQNPAGVQQAPQYPDIAVDTAPTNVVVAGPAHTSTEAAGAIDRSPQSAGTPVVDHPYAAVVADPSQAPKTDSANPDTSPFMKPHDEQQ